MSKTILITGASRGFGKIWAKALLERGDKVVATARNLSDLDDLVSEFGSQVLPLQLDVTNREQSFEAVAKAHAHFGKIDILINNAGYGLFGAVEEASEEEARKQMEVNFFGLLWVTQAVLPFMREQKSGHIIQVSSVLGHITFPTLGLYNASKFAVEGLTETLASEVKEFGIKVSLIEPNGYETDWAGASSAQSQSIEAYDNLKTAFRNAYNPDHYGIPAATTEALLTFIDSPEPPFRLLLGKIGYPAIKATYEQRLATWEAWQEVSVKAHGK
ncbi:NADP-dependent 3-hydroxy acid dehydrogenase YdfG [Arcicella aurantiaca]|uniref:NADP-dependent 3-hydroxy acid dehydrogenase YdfG n=1 Tax=Arcicella aurantiaca TaxID=591202 RepID=A0A316EE29_9BACT|nr:oxidoreductase [Arcicella aurantiaca]PWK27630.1 NADP-dependent 3-hydroxy acid dehydrogenase YdfG [Arcicella aurantiaca]